MTLLYYDPRFLDHQTGTHPERPARVQQAFRQLERTGLDQKCVRPDWLPATREQIHRVHDAGYIERLAEFVGDGGGRIEVDTVVSPESFDVACLAAGAACDAVDRVLKGERKTAFALIRPPGHHALAADAMGFCLLNNVAIAARHALDHGGLDRVLIVDWDVHHGNGTQDAFYGEERVGFLSSHRWPFYPGTGAADETGSGAALGTTVNLPMEFGTPRSMFLSHFCAALESLAARIKPQLVLISAGFDAHRDDPVGSLGLEIEDFQSLTQMVLDVASAHAGGRVVSLLEGGYNPGILAGCVEAHVQELLKSEV